MKQELAPRGVGISGLHAGEDVKNTMTARRVARATRLTEQLGHSDILDALIHAEEMRSALRVIYTWAGIDGEYLDHRQVRKLAAKALHMDATAPV